MPSEAGLHPTSDVLAGGTRVLAARTTTTPAVTISLAVEAGSRHDPTDRPGLAYFASRVIDRGTTSRSAAAIAETLDERGVSLRVGVSRHTLTLGATCLSEDFAEVLALVSDLVRAATYPEAEIETRRGEVLTAIRQDEDSPASVAMERLMALLYGATHPYGRPSKGTTASVSGVTSADLRRFHRDRVTPHGASLVLVGDVDPDQAVSEASQVFEGWPGVAEATTTPVSPPPSATGRQRVVVPMMSKSQADVAYGFTTITRSDPAYYAYWLMANIFGQYGMGGRLGHSIRERQGMAYYAFCGFEAGFIPGPLIVRAGVHGDNVDRAIESIDHEVAALARDGVTEEELANSKRYVIGSLPRTLETNPGIAAFLQNVQQFDLGLDYDRRLPSLVESVSRDAVDDAARRTLDAERAAVVVAGPYDDAGTADGD